MPCDRVPAYTIRCHFLHADFFKNSSIFKNNVFVMTPPAISSERLLQRFANVSYCISIYYSKHKKSGTGFALLIISNKQKDHLNKNHRGCRYEEEAVF